MKQGWTYKKLGEVCDILDSRRKPITKSKRESGSIPYYGATGLLDYVKDYIFDEKLVLLGEDGAKWGAGDKSAFIIEGKTWVNNHAHALRPKRDVLVDELLVYYLNFSNLQPYITGVTVPKLNQEKMRSILIPIAPVSQQQRIVSRLDSAFAHIDELKANAEKQLSEARALFQKALSKAMEPKEGWKKMKLGDFAYMKAGNFVKANEIYPDFKEGLYPCYGGNGFRGYVKEPNQEGDFCLIGRQGALCGCINRAKGIFRTTEHAVIVKPYQDIPTGLVYYLLVNLNLNKYATGAAQPGLSVNHIAEAVTICVPPKDKQQRIVARLDSLSAHVRELEEISKKTIAECDALKQAILRKVFK